MLYRWRSRPSEPHRENQRKWKENEKKFEIQADHLTLARRPDILLTKKIRSFFTDDVAVPANHTVKIKESEKKTKKKFEIQADHLTLARRPDILLTKKIRSCFTDDLAVPENHTVKIKESEKKDKYLDLARKRKKKSMNHEGDSDTNCNWYTRNDL